MTDWLCIWQAQRITDKLLQFQVQILCYSKQIFAYIIPSYKCLIFTSFCGYLFLCCPNSIYIIYCILLKVGCKWSLYSFLLDLMARRRPTSDLHQTMMHWMLPTKYVHISSFPIIIGLHEKFGFMSLQVKWWVTYRPSLINHDWLVLYLKIQLERISPLYILSSLFDALKCPLILFRLESSKQEALSRCTK